MAERGKEIKEGLRAAQLKATLRQEPEQEPKPGPELEKLPFAEAWAKLQPSSPEEIERRRKAREEREADMLRREMSGHLDRLRKDCGERLDPFNRATLKRFEQYDDTMPATLDLLTEFVRNIERHVVDGDGLFFIGPPGTGKDHLAVAVAREAVISLNVSARWLDASTFRSRLRDAIKSSGEEKQLLKPYISAGVLILSDPVAPGSTLTDYQADALFRLIDGRYRECRPTYVTSNFASEAEAVELLGSQIVDRLSHGGLRLRCQWESYRRR
jgi:DNA replication protein DnaC